MDLLEENEEGGYPLEYLLSRIRGRRAFLIKDWEPLVQSENPLEASSAVRHGKNTVDSADALWALLLREFGWVFSQMDRALREIFRPFFLYTELRTLFICLRYGAAGDSVKREQVLVHSLFSKKFKRVLMSATDAAGAVGDIEEVFLSLSARFKGIKEVFLKEGLRGVEHTLTNTYLEHTMGMEIHPVIRDFFRRIIDARNIITLYKCLRWETEGAPPFVRGGGIGERMLEEIRVRENIFGVISVIRAAAGVKIRTPDATAVENALYTGITRFLRRGSRETSGIGFILNYLWRCSVEVRNLSVLLYGKDADREAIREELVQ
jgi:vacuolar-type H+-ATPase subunit C/Vma6